MGLCTQGDVRAGWDLFQTWAKETGMGAEWRCLSHAVKITRQPFRDESRHPFRLPFDADDYATSVVRVRSGGQNDPTVAFTPL